MRVWPVTLASDGRSSMPTPRIQIHLFGPFRLLQDDQLVAGFDQPRLQHLLAYLVLHPAAPISRQQLAFLFWPETTDRQALKNLRTLLTRLRHALPGAQRLVEVTAQTIQWRPDEPLAIDTAEFKGALDEAAALETVARARAADALAVAVAAYRGDLMPDCYDDWIVPLREQFHQAYVEALERLILALEELREYSRALPHARGLVRHDPLHEPAYHHLMRLQLALGDRAEALRAYQACETMLAQEFGTAPARSLRDLYKRLREEDERATLPAGEPQQGREAAPLPLVGRKPEWSRLVTAWRAAAAGRPQMILLTGEAGIGKTRLAEELCNWAARQGATVAAAHCYPESGGATVAYAPVAEWLRSDALRPRVAALADVWLAEIARILPALLTERPHLTPPSPLTEAWQRTRLFEALARGVLGSSSGRGAGGPLLLFLDDLQWCDQETLNWLGYLLRFAATAPLLLVATARKYEVDKLHPLMAFWLGLARSGLLDEILLSPLDATETGLLAANVAGRMIDASEATEIYHDTEGNPLFVVETLRAEMADEQTGREGDRDRYVERGIGPIFPAAPSFAPAALPTKVRAVIQWRLAQLSPAAQSLAQVASVIGRRFSLEVLARVAGQDEAQLVEVLDELWRRHIVRMQGGEAYDFSHDGIRAVAYDDTGPILRRAIHLRVARALEALYPGELDALGGQIARQAEAAHHYEQAGQVQPAVQFYRRAAAAAEAVYANAAAAQLYEHLLDSQLSSGLSSSDRCAAMLAFAEILAATGQRARSERIARDALTEAEALNAPQMVSQARRVLGDALQLLGYYDAALQLLAGAEQGFDALGDWRGVVSTLRTVGQVHWRRGAQSQALATLERQLEIATRIDDPRGISEALEKTGMVLWRQGDWERAASYCLKATELASSLEYKPVLASASITLGNILSGERRFAEAVHWYRQAGALANELDDRPGLTWVISNIALILANRGDYRRASAGYELSLRKAWEIGDRWTAALNVAGLAAVKERLGRVDEAERLHRKAIFFEQRLGIPAYLAERYRMLPKDTPDLPPLPDVSDLIPDQRESFDLALTLEELEASFAGIDGA